MTTTNKRALHGRDVVQLVWAWDLWVAIAVAAGAGLLCLDDHVRAQGPTMLLATAAAGAAFLATVLTALSVVATFFDSAYRRVLEEAHDGDLRPALAPYAVVAYAAAVATVLGLLGGLAWRALPGGLAAVVMGVSVLTAVWAILGTASLVELTLFHAKQRAATMRATDLYREGQASRQRSAAPTRARAPRA